MIKKMTTNIIVCVCKLIKMNLFARRCLILKGQQKRHLGIEMLFLQWNVLFALIFTTRVHQHWAMYILYSKWSNIVLTSVTTSSQYFFCTIVSYSAPTYQRSQNNSSDFTMQLNPYEISQWCFEVVWFKTQLCKGSPWFLFIMFPIGQN